MLHGRYGRKEDKMIKREEEETRISMSQMPQRDLNLANIVTSFLS